jgi:hypothetical protein
MEKHTVFISYSHKDEEWKKRLVTHLEVLHQQGLLDPWNDRNIGAGEDWELQILSALNAASVAILLISANFLSSTFILEKEIPVLLHRRDTDGVRIFPIIIKPCAWRSVPWLSKMQVRPVGGLPLSDSNSNQTDAYLTTIGTEIWDLLKRSDRYATHRSFARLPPDKIYASQLPATRRDLFGRQAELSTLDESWNNPNTNIISIVAWGGMGKSSLINHWLQRISRDNYRGAMCIFAWSFDNQSAVNEKLLGDDFIESALRWFEYTGPSEGTDQVKGEQLAKLIRAQRTLLILDGIELLQFPPGRQEGRFRHEGLRALLRELAAYNPGLCVVATRLAMSDLEDFERGTAQRIDLGRLPPKAGAQLLKAQGVKGRQGELERATKEYGGHALALTLLGSYLTDVCDSDIRRRNEIETLQGDNRYGGHAQQVLKSYEKWLGEGAEIAVLRVLGAFNRPVHTEEIIALAGGPVLPHLTDSLQSLSIQTWEQTFSRLRRAGLLSAKDKDRPRELDAHQLVRDYFREQLEHDYPDVWQEFTRRLKLIRYKVLFVKPGHECVLSEGWDTVPDNIDFNICASLKKEQLLWEMRRGRIPVPGTWQIGLSPKYVRAGKLRGLSEEDKEYLRVYFEVFTAADESSTTGFLESLSCQFGNDRWP